MAFMAMTMCTGMTISRVLTGRSTEEEVEKLLTVYRELTGIEARSFAAPGWMINPHVLRFSGERSCLQQRYEEGDSPVLPGNGR